MKYMKKRIILPLFSIAATFCIGTYALLTSPTALLENDAFYSPYDILWDEVVPLTEQPAEVPEMYEGLDETQIQYVNEVLELVNEARAEAGLNALTLNASLRQAAQVRAVECVGTFSHTRPNGTSYKTAITEAGISAGYTGENVATGHSSPSQVVSRWLQSEGHRANILNSNYTQIGIGVQPNSGNGYKGYCWTQLFIN